MSSFLSDNDSTIDSNSSNNIKKIKNVKLNSTKKKNVKKAETAEELKNIISKKIKNTYDKNVEKIKKNYNYDEEIKKNEKQTNELYIATALLTAENIWLSVKLLLLNDYDKFFNLKDEKKIEIIKSNYPEFYEEFPIVSRYMICLEKYSMKAFTKYLNKTKTALSDLPADRPKEYRQNKWIECQADYIRYLWEEGQNGRINKKESNKVWDDAYKKIKKEFKDFNKMHKNAEEQIKKNDIKYKNELLKELALKLINKEQQFEDKNTDKELIILLQNKLYKQKFNKTMKQIYDSVEIIKASFSGYGKNINLQSEYDEELKQSEYKKKINSLQKV